MVLGLVLVENKKKIDILKNNADTKCSPLVLSLDFECYHWRVVFNLRGSFGIKY